jgi:hypothetical protein
VRDGPRDDHRVVPAQREGLRQLTPDRLPSGLLLLGLLAHPVLAAPLTLAILACGVPEAGFVRLRCPDCGRGTGGVPLCRGPRQMFAR